MGNLLVNALLSALLGIIVFIILSKKNYLRADEILIAIIAGLCAVFPASLFEYAISVQTASITGLLKIFINAFFIASFIEETAKFFIIKILYSIKKIDNFKSGLVIAIAAGTGFACLENIMYSFDSSLIVIFRVFSAMPLHIITAGIIGYFFIQKTKLKKSSDLRGYIEAFLIHGSYNFLISLKSFISFLAIPLLIWAGYRVYSLYKTANTENINS